MKECENKYPWDDADDAIDSFQTQMVTIIVFGGMAIVIFFAGVLVYLECERDEYQVDYGLGSVVTTTAEYEYMTNDSFTGVVVRGEGRGDPAITVRNRDGTERRIATEFLEPME